MSGFRLPVATVLRMLAAGLSEAQILDEYPDLESADIRECLQVLAAAPTKSLRFLVDNALPPKLARLLTESGHDTSHVRDYGMQGGEDQQILELAREEDLVILSQHC